MSYRDGPKRVFDLVVSIFAASLILPMIVFAVIAIKFTSTGPVFFRQERIGLGGRPFSIIKLRTMTVDLNRLPNQTHNGDPEVLPIGRFFRRFKIDELPQVFNVFKGDMSLVGTRPCLKKTYNHMPSWASKRVEVRPGITGLAQNNGNVALTWEERWKYDVRYVETLSFWGDVKLLLKTIIVVIMGEKRFKEAT